MTTPRFPVFTPPPPNPLRRRRRLMFWLSLPVVLVMVVVAFKLLSLAPTAERAIDAYEYGDYLESQEQSTSLMGWNIVEPYLPYFNRGDAFAADNYLGAAIDDFEIALELAPMDRKCDVRLNLALAWERFGDYYVQYGFPQGAVLLYEASQSVLDAAGEECDPPENQEQLTESKDRVEQKKSDAEEQRDAQQPPEQDDTGQSEQERQLEELEQQQQEAAQEKADDQAEERSEQNGGSYTDKPW